MRLNKWVWTKAVRRSGKSSGSREDSKTASGQQPSQHHGQVLYEQCGDAV
jgi:hypothetical protein